MLDVTHDKGMEVLISSLEMRKNVGLWVIRRQTEDKLGHITTYSANGVGGGKGHTVLGTWRTLLEKQHSML